MAEEKRSSRFWGWLAGIVAAIIGGLILFAIENYQRPGVAMYWDNDRAAIPTMKVTVINKSNIPFHRCWFSIHVIYNLMGEGHTKFSDDFELGPHEARVWNFTPDDLGITGYEHLIEPVGLGSCFYFGTFGTQESVDFHVYD